MRKLGSISRDTHENRPLRFPPDAVVGTIDPPFMVAGSVGTWRLRLTVEKEIEGKNLLLWLGGHRWVKLNTLCQNSDPGGEGYVSARMLGGAPLEPEPRDKPSKIHDLMKVLFRVPSEGIPSGTTLEFVLGDTSKGSPGLRGPSFTVPNVFFPLTLESELDAREAHELRWVGGFVLDFVGGPLHGLRALAPSAVSVGESFSITIRPQDRFGCMSPQVPGSLRITLDGREMDVDISAERINQAGAVEISGLTLSERGIHRVTVEDPETRLCATSNPISVGDHATKLYWGLIHEHTELSDGAGSPDVCYVNMRCGSRLDFGAVSDHDHRFETSDEMWEMAKRAAERHNNPGNFTTFLGYEWAKWRRNGDGDRNVYYLGAEGPMFRSETGECDTPQKLFEALKDYQALIIPHHTAYTGNFCDWTQHETEKERLVEIYSVWGSSEMGSGDGNRMPVRNPRDYDPTWIAISGSKPQLGEEPVGFVRSALMQGWRVGFTAGGDMHRSHPGNDVKQGYPPHEYKPGITAIWAEKNNRDALWSSLWGRSCYATTGERMIISMSVDGHPMGSEISPSGNHREIVCSCHGTDEIILLELVRNGEAIRRESPGSLDVSVSWQDADNLKAIAIGDSKWRSSPFVFYYLRVQQRNGEMAWTSPVWVDVKQVIE